ncbi:hypothetical protein EX895_000797 [Sporisorium graminicola]|uniref:Homeobox domain-containing protein n=1 Tax=Sporisorium graminicola TaxID=280036 RepID=A0A4V6EUI0_9BASI|nr:hypothetical protein EX895_000797 [Sporisorium graminicola]TKY90799.1 hypothetical protein EX895_000797 [Sporisorium graminicola]
MSMTPTNSFTFAGLLRSLRDIENDFLSVDGDEYADLVGRLEALQARVVDVQSEHLGQKAIDEAHHASQRISLIAHTRLSLVKTFEELNSKMLREAKKTIEDHMKPKQYVEVQQDLSETLPSYHMRKHFLVTLDSPYPTQADKEALVQITNDSSAGAGRPPLETHQLTLWFINARRRSGWSNILRKFARGDRSRMMALVKSKMVSSRLSAPLQSDELSLIRSLDDNLSDNLGRPLTAADKKEFEEDWDSMISWIRYGVKEKVGEWVYDLVAASKKPSKPGQARAVTTPSNRTPARKTAAQALWKSRKAKPRASTTPSVDSTISSSGLESTPELSMCSTADTSLSSSSSNLSITHYEPFPRRDGLLQSPTLHAKRIRRVKALPKRVAQQKPHSNDEKAIDTCLPVPKDFNLPCTHEQVEDSQDASHISTQAQLYLPYDAFRQAPMPLSGMRRDSVSFNSLSAAFG